MTSRSAVVLVVLVVAMIAFCFAGVFAAMTGTYHLNLDFGNNDTDGGGFFGNLTEFNSEGDSSGSSSGSVQTYEDTSSGSSSNTPQENTQPSEEPAPSEGGDSGQSPAPDTSGDNQIVTVAAY